MSGSSDGSRTWDKNRDNGESSMNKDTRDYMMENRLRKLDPELHRRFTDTVFGLQDTLFHFRALFPEFTDHSSLHSLTVIDFCNRLIGPEQIGRLNADAIYVLLMSCYLHDVGMGISEEQYRTFSREIDFGDYFEKHPNTNTGMVIRDFHQEFSAAFIRRFSSFLAIPTPAHEHAIIQVCRGHRRTDLFDASGFPQHYEVPGGNEICLPYLAALIRLADEIDVAAFRNSKLLYHLEAIVDEKQIVEHKRHQAVKDLIISEKAFTLLVDTPEEEIKSSIFRMAEKMQITLDDCRRVIEEHTPYMITQEKIIVETMA